MLRIQRCKRRSNYHVDAFIKIKGGCLLELMNVIIIDAKEQLNARIDPKLNVFDHSQLKKLSTVFVHYS
jgi:hypothetical protein